MNSNVSRRRNLDTNSGPYSRLKCLRPLLAAPFLAGLLLASSLPTTAQVTIDSFTTNQATITDPPGGASTAVTGGADILGGKRGLKVRNLAGPGPTTAGVSGGFLEIGVTATTPDSQGEVDLFWDGDSDNNPATFDPTGLGAVDLTAGGTQGGFLLLVDSAQAGSHLILSVWEDADRVSRVGRVLPAIAAPTPIFLGFSELTASPGAVAPADLTQVGAITLRLGATESASPPVLRIDSLTTAAPSLAAAKVDTLAGVPVTGPVNPGTTLRYRVTIANEGAGAQGVGFEDLVTDLNLGAPSGVRTTALARRDQYSTVTGVPVDTAVDGLPGLLANDSDADGDALT
ncbi:MAG: hypothetical protein KDD47_02670, partial [Acidobacteria bacterium]|nr:hypothetical protein [Acidobacteriota bacterium]